MAKFQYVNGIGNVILSINGKPVTIIPGQIFEVSEGDSHYEWLINNRKFKKISDIISDSVVPKVDNVLTEEDLIAISGVGKASAEKVIKALGENLTWENLGKKGEKWLIDLLPDNVAKLIWKEILKRGGN